MVPLRVSVRPLHQVAESLRSMEFGAGHPSSEFTLNSLDNVTRPGLNQTQVLFDGNPAPMMYGSAPSQRRWLPLDARPGMAVADHSLGWRGAIASAG